MGIRVSHRYLIGIQLERVALSIAHDTDLHGKEHIGLLGLDQGQPWLSEWDIIFLLEVLVDAHIGDLASGFLSHVEFVLFSIESRDLLNGPDLCL